MSDSQGRMVGNKLVISVAGDNLAFTASVTINFEGEPLDITNSASGGWRELLEGEKGVKGVSISGTALFDNQASMAKVKQAHTVNGSHLALVITFDDTGETLTGTFAVSEYSQQHPVNGVSTCSFAMQSSGEVT